MHRERIVSLTARLSLWGPFWAVVVLADLVFMRPDAHPEGFFWLTRSALVALALSLASGLTSLAMGWVARISDGRRVALLGVLLNTVVALVAVAGSQVIAPFVFA